MTGVSGIGMAIAVYDPNGDGLIAVAQTEADMKKSAYDPDADGKIALAQLEYETDTPQATAEVFASNEEKGAGGTTVTQWFLAFLCLFKGTYSMEGQVKHTSGNDAHLASMRYKVNAGADTIVGDTTFSDTYVEKVLSGTISCEIGDVIHIGVKSSYAQAGAYVNDVRIRIHTFDTVK